MKVYNYDIVGASEIFKDHTVTRNMKLCYHSGWNHEGIHMGTALWRLGDRDPNLGLRMKNVTLSGFDYDAYDGYNCKSQQASIRLDLHHASIAYGICSQ